jgi:uncharacterized damage-inducible protein DinB
MSEISQFILFSEYNQLMNQRQYAAAGKLSNAELCEDKGAYFKSILGTLNHILVGDMIWLRRFAVHPSSRQALSYVSEQEPPKSLDSILFIDFPGLKAEREKIDEMIVRWIKRLSAADLHDCISYSNMSGTTFSKPFVSLINHLFLHQIHHRGQVTTLLSQCGVDFGETDLIEIIRDCAL